MEPKQREFTPEELATITAQQAKLLGKALDAPRIAQEIKLRQWCVEQAIRTIEAIKIPEPARGKDSTTVNINVDVCSIAVNILAFVSSPLYAKKEAPGGDAP